MAKEVKEASTSAGQGVEAKSSNVTPEVAKSAEPTQDELKEQLKVALASNDWKTVTKVSGVIAKQQVAVERTEREAKEQEVIKLAEEVKVVIDGALEDMIVTGYLDKADGVWYSHDFGDKSSSIRLLSKPVKGTSTKSSGGAGKKFAVTKDELMSACGSEQYKESGMTCAEFFESTTDGNARYQLRVWMLKKAGFTS